MCFNLKTTLLIALLLLPLSATLIHAHVHPDVQWVFYFTLFDVIVITALFAFERTKMYGFWLNTIFGAVGLIYHLQTSIIGTLSDQMIIFADLLIGYALISLTQKSVITKVKVPRRKRKTVRRKR
jgi:hypothetical protein